MTTPTPEELVEPRTFGPCVHAPTPFGHIERNRGMVTTGQEVTMPDEGGWRTIDSAPKDGTVILTICTYDNPPTYELNAWYELSSDRYVEAGDGLYRKEVVKFSDGWSNNGHRASHWMPLPPPPKDSHNERSEG